MKTFPVKLGVKDRLCLLGILPREGNYTNLKLYRSLKEDLAINDTEKETLKLVELGNGMITWDVKGADSIGSRVFSIDEATFALVIEVLKRLDEGKGLKEDHINLYELFVLGRWQQQENT